MPKFHDVWMSFVSPSVRPSVRSSVRLSVHPSVGLSISVRPLVRSSVRPFVCPSVCPEKNNLTSKTRTLIIFSPFCSVKKSVLSRFWIHISVFPNKLYIKIKLIVQAFQIYNYLLTEIIMKRIIWHQRREHW
jgi:hypothetical protein